MRRVIVIAAVLASLPHAADAQGYATDRSSLLVDGSAGYTRSSLETTVSEIRTNQLSFAPSLQYFVAPGFAVGATLDLRSADSEYESDVLPAQSSTVTAVGLGPTLSYYWGSRDRRLLPFVSATYAFQRVKIDSDLTDQEQSTRSVEAAVGVLVLLAEHVGLTAEGFIRDGTIEDQDGDESDERTSGLRLGIATFVF